MTKEQLDRALEDEDRYVRIAAAKNPSVDSESLSFYKMKYLT